MKQTRLLITGANGFIGRAMIDHFSGHKRQDRFHVTACVRSSDSKVTDSIENHTCDLTDHAAVQKMIAVVQPDVIIDCAGVTPHRSRHDADYMVNPTMVQNLVQAIGDSGRTIGLIHLSSVSVYGPPVRSNGVVHEDDPLNPHHAYAQSKTVCERIIRNQKNLNYAILRVANVAGKDAFINHVLDNQNATLRGDTPFKRDIIMPADIASMVEALLPPMAGGMQAIYNCGSGVGYSFADIILEIESQTGSKVTITHSPLSENDIPRLICDRQKAKDDLGWDPISINLPDLIRYAIQNRE